MKKMAYDSIDFLRHKFPDLDADLSGMGMSQTMMQLQESQIDLDDLLKSQKDLDNTRQKAQLQNLYLAEGSNSQILDGM